VIAKIIPAVRLPCRAAQIYDYAIPDGLASGVVPGAVVAVPFSGRLIAGLVAGVSAERSERPLKEIHGVLDSVVYPAYWIKLIAAIASEFAGTAPRFCWAALPPVMRRWIKTSAAPLTNENGGAINNFEEKIICVDGQQDLIGAFEETINNRGDGQALILVPTVNEATRWSKESPQAAIYHSRLSAGEKYNIYSSCASGAAKIIVGTKSAVFLPFKNLRSILIINAGSSAHINEDLDPRYDGRIIARLLARAAGAKLTFADALPPLSLGTILNKPAAASDARYAICDLADAGRRERAKVLLCDETIAAATATLGSGGRALFLLNRRGTGSAIICKDCGHVNLCPLCKLPLLVMSDEMQCFACGKKYPLATNCQNCDGTNLKTVGSGVRGLFAQLKKLFPAAKALLIEGGMVQADPDEYDMVVATTAIFYALKPRFREFDLAVEALLGAGTGKAGVYAIEETARIIRELNATVNAGGRLFIQTYDKANPALLAIADLEKFALQELNERKIFSYPPFSKLVTLLGAGKDEDKILNEAKKISDALKKSELAAISEPTWHEPKFFRGKYRIKISAKAAPRQNTDFLVKYLPNGWNAEIKDL
jgi:primosomal protein N' (replication factor Y) (superfamily II helicase)